MTTSAPIKFDLYRKDGDPRPRGPVAPRERGRYLPSDDLVDAVNTALACGQPLLVTGEPGTGKTALAESIAWQLGLGEVLEFHTRSDHRARDVLYTFDSLRRFYDAQIHDARATDPENYVALAALGQAIRSEQQRVVLIDEIDKAPRDFPNDLLNVIDRMEFEVVETGKRFRSAHRPVVIITSNAERPLPGPFLRRCVFHYIEFPSAELLRDIVRQRIGEDDQLEALAKVAVDRFVALRDTYGSQLSRQPATGELLAWVRVLIRLGRSASDLGEGKKLPYLGTLLKTQDDLRRVLEG